VRDTLRLHMEHTHTEELEEGRAGIHMAKLAAAFIVVAVLSFVGGTVFSSNGGSNIVSAIPLLGDGLDATPDQSANLASFWKAWNTLNDRFVETHASSTAPGMKNKIWGAMQGLAASYGDPYTVYLPPEDAKIFQEDITGNFGGVGMEIAVNKDGILTVIAPLKGTPAERAGIKSGDLIATIDTKATDGMSSDEAVKLIRGEKGTTVTFRVMRDGEVLVIPVTRDTIQIPTIDSSLNTENGVYTISLYSFTANSANLFSKALSEFRSSGSTKLIIDLRGNPGGYLAAAVSMASHFLPDGAAVVTEDYAGKRENIVHASNGTGGIPAGTKVVILMDQGSASASEILAGALQDDGIAKLVGTRSFGKGSVQELVDIDGGSLKVTVARWLTPSGRSISDGGLTPDIEVKNTKESLDSGHDLQKERAVQYLVNGN